MNIEQYKSLVLPTPVIQYVNVNEISGPDRTLMYGYNTNRDTFHLFWKDNIIHSIYYNSTAHRILSRVLYYDKIEALKCVPDKRVYPERCDYEFCKLLYSKGINIPFTTFVHNVEKKKFSGLTDYTGWN